MINYKTKIIAKPFTFVFAFVHFGKTGDSVFAFFAFGYVTV
jgi:hypothetical protein